MAPAGMEGNVERRIVRADGLEHVIGAGFQTLGMNVEMQQPAGEPELEHRARSLAHGNRFQQGAERLGIAVRHRRLGWA